jgi:mono/diheme cytochrome c family protein
MQEGRMTQKTRLPSEPQRPRSGRLKQRTLILAMVLAVPAADAQNFERGRHLYDNHCQACHSAQLHRREASKVKSLADLRRRVAAWGEHAGENWGSSEINDVTHYLERSFYHFEETTQ